MRTPLAAVAALLFACSHAAPAPAPQAAGGDWISRSNQNAQLLLDVQAKFAPEFAARTGVAGIHDPLSPLTPRGGGRARPAGREGPRGVEGSAKNGGHP